MRIAEAYVEIKGDYKMFRSELSKEGKSAGQQVAGAFASAFAAAAFTGGIAKSIGAANRLQQAVGATEAVFGSAGKAVEDFAETSAKSFGISEAAARELTSQIGALLQGMGFTAEQAAATSVDIAKLGADLAATFGGKPEEAVLALGAALRGERDPIERYGISLNEAAVKQKALELGLYDGVGALDANGRAQATLALITERSAGAQGQFARESTTAAGAQAIAAASAEDAAASFGEVLLPVYTRVVEVAGALAGVFGKLPVPVQTAVVALAGLVVFAGPIRTLVGNVKSLEAAFKLAGISGRAFTTSLGVAGGLIAAAITAYQIYSGRKAEATQRTKDLGAALREEGAAQNEALAALAQNNEKVRSFVETQDRLGISTDELNQFIREGTGPVGELAAKWKEVDETTNGTNPQLEALAVSMGLTTGETIESMAAIRNFILESLNLQAAETDRAAVQQLVTEVTEAGTTATDANTTAVQGGIGAIEHLAEKLATARERLDELAASTIASTNADINYEDQVWQTAFALEEYNTSMIEGNLTLEEARGLFETTRDKLLQQAEAFVEAEGASLDSEAGARLYKEELGRLAGQLAPGSELRRFLDDYIGDLNRVPRNITTTVRVNQEGGVDINGDGRIDAKALGGPVAGGVPVLVGEKGPEVFVPSVPGQIIPNNQLKTGGSSTWMNTGAMTILSNKLAQITDEVDESGSALRVSLEEYIATLNRIPRLITTTVQVNQEGAVDINSGGVGGQVGASGGGMSAEQFGREAARAMARELRVLMRVG